MLDLVADVGVTIVWAVKLLAWFFVAGCVASGSAAAGLPEPSSWPPRPKLVRWHRANRTMQTEIEHARHNLGDRPVP